MSAPFREPGSVPGDDRSPKLHPFTYGRRICPGCGAPYGSVPPSRKIDAAWPAGPHLVCRHSSCGYEWRTELHGGAAPLQMVDLVVAALISAGAGLVLGFLLGVS